MTKIQSSSRPKTTQSKISSQAWIAWSIVTFFYAFQYVLRVFPSIMIDNIRLKFGVDTQQFGDFSGTYYLGYALMHIPIGLLLDHKSPRYVIALSALLCSLGILPLIYSDSWTLAVIGRFLTGAGSVTAILGVFKIIRLNFPSQKFGTVLGFSVMVGVLGAIYGGLPVQGLVDSLGWTTVLYGFVMAGVILALAVIFLIPKRQDAERTTSHGSLSHDLGVALKTPYVMTTALLAALMVGPLEGFADVWGVSYLIQSYGFSKETASYLPSLIFFGMCFGSPALAYLGERTGRYRFIVQSSALLMGVFFIFFLIYMLPLWGIQISFLLVGVLSAYQVIVMHINSLRVEEKYSGIVTALTNMVIMSFGYIFHHFIGRIMNSYWAGETVGGIRVYPVDAYDNGLMIIPFALFLAFLGFYGEKIHAKLKGRSLY
ncbi:MAG TPA: MFS transporter [Holosporales bacterium]|nr:MFS transporter [Holosporales bacterium]